MSLEKVVANVFQMKKTFDEWGFESDMKIKISRVEGNLKMKDWYLEHVGKSSWKIFIDKKDMIEVKVPNIDLAS